MEVKSWLLRREISSFKFFENTTRLGMLMKTYFESWIAVVRTFSNNEQARSRLMKHQHRHQNVKLFLGGSEFTFECIAGCRAQAHTLLFKWECRCSADSEQNLSASTFHCHRSPRLLGFSQASSLSTIILMKTKKRRIKIFLSWILACWGRAEDSRMCECNPEKSEEISFPTHNWIE